MLPATLHNLSNSAFRSWKIHLIMDTNTVHRWKTATYQNAWQCTMRTYWAVAECVECIEKVKYCSKWAASSPSLSIICLSIQAFLPLSKPSTLFHMSTFSICQLFQYVNWGRKCQPRYVWLIARNFYQDDIVCHWYFSLCLSCYLDS